MAKKRATTKRKATKDVFLTFARVAREVGIIWERISQIEGSLAEIRQRVSALEAVDILPRTLKMSKRLDDLEADVKRTLGRVPPVDAYAPARIRTVPGRYKGPWRHLVK